MSRLCPGPFVVAAFCGLLFAGRQPASAQTPNPKGDPLPAGAVARLDGIGFWHGTDILTLAFSADDRVVASYSVDERICLWDASTGRLIRRLDLPRDRAIAPAPVGGIRPAAVTFNGPCLQFAGNGKALVVADVGPRVYRVVDATTGKELHQVPMPGTTAPLYPATVLPAGAVGPVRLIAGPVALSPDASLLALGGEKDHAVVVWDLARGAVRYRLAGHEDTVQALAFAPDGKALVSAGADQSVRLWDVAAGKAVRAFDGHRGTVTDVAFLPDGRQLVSVGEDGTLRLWTRDTGKMVLRADWLPPGVADTPRVVSTIYPAPTGPRVWVDAAGKQVGCLYPVSETHPSTVRGGVRTDVFICYDVATGKEVRRTSLTAVSPLTNAAAARLSAYRVAVQTSALGQARPVLARSTSTHHIQFYSLETGNRLPGVAGGGAGVVDVEAGLDRVTFVRDGDRAIHVWDRTTGQVRRMEGHTGRPLLIATGPDGRHLISASLESSDRSIGVWDTVKGEEARPITGWNPGNTTPQSQFVTRSVASLRVPALSPDGKHVALRGRDDRVRVVTTATGKTVFAVDVPWKGVCCLAFTADGKHLIVTDSTEQRQFNPAGGMEVKTACVVRLLDAASGKEVRQLGKRPYSFLVRRVAATEDRLLLGCRDGLIRVMDLATGEEVRSIVGRKGPQQPQPVGGFVTTPDLSPAFLLSSDRRTLAIFDGPDNSIRLWELGSDRERGRCKGHPGRLTSFALTTDGRHVVTGSQDGTVLVWALLAPLPGVRADLTDPDLQTLWNDLGSVDAIRAIGAVRRLMGAPDRAVSLLRERLKAAAPPDERLVQEKLRDLDSRVYAQRQRAEKELAGLGEAIVPALERFLAGKLSAEARTRAEGLYRRVRAGTASGERLRELRAVEVLEAVGTAPAQELLRQLAGGAPGARLTREASAAVQRLALRAGA